MLSETVESEESQALYSAFLRKRLAVVTPCDGRAEEYVDWTVPPTEGEARLMCMECPLRVDCREVAESMLAPWGVWGGRVCLGYDDEEEGDESERE